MTDLALDDYYCGGYFLIRAKERADWLNTGLLPSSLVSLSTHISPRFKLYWGWKPINKQEPLSFGFPQNQIENFLSWCQSSFADENVIYPGIFPSVQKAQKFVADFELDKADLHIIGIGIQKDELEQWLSYQEAEPELGKFIKKEAGFAPRGAILGHEVIEFSYHDFGCSWLCNGVEKDGFEQFGIKPNQYGLITDYADAKKICDWIMVDPASRAEPMAYNVWLLVSYPLE